jgi:tellurite resistance protein TerC
MHSIGTMWMWLGFFIFILVMLAIDIFLSGEKKSSILPFRKALIWSLVWISCALIFDGLLWFYLYSADGILLANEKALEFLTGYLIEKSLSIDNLFVFYMIFTQFAVPLKLQQRALLFGVLGALILRLLMILFGTWLVVEWSWTLYLFGFFLVVTGIKMLFFGDGPTDFMQHPVVQWCCRHLRITPEFQGQRFFIKQKSKVYATRLFLVLVLIEVSDLIFAMDSIPAIFAITQDPFIVFTSNIFAILGLRALYFLLAAMAERFHLLKYGIAFMLIFVGIKMLIVPWVMISTPIALAGIFGILGITILLSMVYR